jgi:hypothetical protein
MIGGLFFFNTFNSGIMKMTKIYTGLFLLVFGFSMSFSLSAQDCKFYFPTEVGTLIEMTNYDKKGKVAAVMTQKILEKKEVDGAMVVVFEQTSKDAKGKNEMTAQMEVSCKDGKFYFDLDNYLQGMNLEEYEENPDMDIVVDGDEIFYPAELNAGETLPDGSLSVKVMAGGFAMMNMTVDITNRRVGELESVTTPAGTFNCHKLTQDVEVKSIMKIKTSETSWLAENIGVVKTESYDKGGKLTGTSELTKIER